MKPRFRLTNSTDFKRVRRYGKSYAHPLVVLVVQPNETNQLLCGVTAGRSVGGAVCRNRAKRRLRGVMQPLFGEVVPGWDLVLIARRSLLQAPYPELQAAVSSLLKKAGLLSVEDERP